MQVMSCSNYNHSHLTVYIISHNISEPEVLHMYLCTKYGNEMTSALYIYEDT